MTHINESMMKDHYEKQDTHYDEPSFKFAQESTHENIIDCFSKISRQTGVVSHRVDNRVSNISATDLGPISGSRMRAIAEIHSS